MILYIAEKPSLGRAIADALPKPHQRGDGFIRTGDGAVVSWCIGHMLEQAEPEAYDPAFKKWSHEHLPIIPAEWKLTEKKQTIKQLRVLRKLVKEADSIVHAGDPDREGQLLVDEVIHFLGKSPQAAKRLLINDLNRSAVINSLGKLRDNRDFKPLSTSALARSRADWIYGINLTRAYTLQGQKVNYKGVLSVGRVQTPLLGLVVRRDAEIDKFVSVPFYEVWANLTTLPRAGAEPFRARWVPSEECAKFLDSEGRNLSKPLADNVAGRITHQEGLVRKVERKKRRSLAPLPHSLSSLQIDAGRRYHMPAKKVLDVCQALYEQHKLITYPRSDSRYLPVAHHKEAPAVVEAISHNWSDKTLDKASKHLDLKRRSKTWNDAKVDAHHAIIPTARKVSNMSTDEIKVYGLISRNYIAQFLPTHEYAETLVELEIKGGLFVTRAKEELVTGWKVLFANANKEGDKDDATVTKLPSLKVGETVNSLVAEVVEKHTSPPARFNDATLLKAMTGIAAYVNDPGLRKILKETDGLGTEATRAGIIELLFHRGFLSRVGKHIESTAPGRGLIQALPETATFPDMTARWESILTAITERSASYDSLMKPLQSEVTRLVDESQQQVPHGLAGLSSPVRRGTKTGKGQGNKRVRANRKSAAGRIAGAKTTRKPTRKPTRKNGSTSG